MSKLLQSPFIEKKDNDHVSPRILPLLCTIGAGLICFAVSVHTAHAQNVFVSDSNGVQEYDKAGVLVKSFTSGINPSGLAFNANGNLFVADDAGRGGVGEIREYGTNGSLSKTFGGNDISNLLGSLVINQAGNLLVADIGNADIEEYDPSGNFLRTFTTGGDLTSPKGLAFDRAGNLFVSDIYRANIQEFDQSGNFLRVFAPGGGGTNLTTPGGLAFDATGNLFVTDFDTDLVFEYDANGNKLKTFGSGFNGPSDLSFDSAGDLFVTDTNNNDVQEYDAGGNKLRTFGNGLSGPQFIAIGLATPVPEASTSVSMGLMFVLGLGGLLLTARKRQVSVKAKRFRPN